MPSLKYAVSDMSVLEEMADKDTPVHRLHPAAKILVCIVYITAVISFDRYEAGSLMPFLFYPAILLTMAKLPLRPLLSRLVLALPFCILAGLSNVFFDTDIAFTVGSITISYGWISFVTIVIKAVLSVSAILLLSATTPTSELSAQLIRFKVPPIIVMQLTMTYRYISVLLEETSTMYTAYILRTPRQKGVRMKDMGVFVGQLLLRSIDRAERIYIAMKCRGYNGVTGYAAHKKLRLSDLLYLTIPTMLMILFRFVNLSMLIGSLLV